MNDEKLIRITCSVKDQDIQFKLGNTLYPASKLVFAQYSLLFKKDINLLKKDIYEVTSKTSHESFKMFLSACQLEPYVINSSNVLEIQNLCKEFDTPSIMEAVKKFYCQENHGDDKLINDIIKASKNDNECLLLIESAAERVGNLVESSLFSQLDLKIIFNIFNHPKVNLNGNDNAVLEYAYDLYHELKIKEDFTPILKNINIEILSQKNLEKLSKMKPKVTDGSSSIKCVLNLMKQNETLRNDLNKRAIEIEKLINKANDEQKISENKHREYIEANKKNEQIFANATKLEEESINMAKCLRNVSIEFAKAFPFNGILNDLKDMGNNWKLTEHVEIITPHKEDPAFPALNMFHKSKKLIYFMKVDEPDQNWITFHFLRKKVSIWAISVQTNSSVWPKVRPKKFGVFGSNDNQNWVQIIEFDDKDGSIFNEDPKTATAIRSDENKDKEICKYFSFIRYRQYEGQLKYIDHECVISLTRLELFGDIIEEEKKNEEEEKQNEEEEEEEEEKLNE